MTTFVPAVAQEAVAQIVDHLCQEIVFGRFKQEEWWDTVEVRIRRRIEPFSMQRV
jgi:hypothetical protein